MFGEIVKSFVNSGIDPKLIHQFLEENISISEQLYNDLATENCPIVQAKNEKMLVHVKMLMMILDKHYQREVK